MQSKILSLEALIEKISELKKQGKTIVQSHGVYDVIHPGIVQHLKLAKEQGDVLVVTVIRDQFVRLGPGRPIFNELLRLQNVVALQSVDYVALVDEKVPFACVRLLKPDVFAKGQAVRERDQAVHGGIFDEEKQFNFGKTRIVETSGFAFNTQSLVNNFLAVYPEDTRRFLKEFSKKYTFKYFTDQLDKLSKLNVLLIGDGIIDEYHYCNAMGRASKVDLVVNRYLTHEIFAGGVFALANHLSGLCRQVALVSLLGTNDSREEFIAQRLKPNITPKYFYRKNSGTIVKKRYVNNYSGQKLFEINFLDDHSIDEELEDKILNFLHKKIKEYDVVLISDFGHGFITDRIIKLIVSRAAWFAVNTQTNAANAGYNLITKYRHPNFICVDESEVRLAAQEKHGKIELVAKKIRTKVKAQNFIVTLGKNGSIGFGPKGEFNRTPIFSTKVVDTIGAGDAFFAFTAPCFAAGMPLDVVSLIGNVVGALAVQIVGNKKPVEKHEVLEFIYNLVGQ
ncbi:MAG: PfkB family carbohydrate kinase [Candidatus Margulisiibacteriota bacterium]